MDVLARLSSLEEAELFGPCMALDLPTGMDCSDLPSPAVPEAVRQQHRVQHLDTTAQPGQLQIPDPYTMDLQDCLASPAFEATLFGLTDHLTDQFTEQFMETQFAFDMSNEQNAGDMADTENAATDLSSRVSKESSAEMFHTPRCLHSHAENLAPGAHSLGANSFTTLGTSQWPCSYPASFIPAHGPGGIPVSCPSSSSSYAQLPAKLPFVDPAGSMLLKNGPCFLQGAGSGAANQSLAAMLDALESPTSMGTYPYPPDQLQARWAVCDGADQDGLHRQSESGSSCQVPSRGWQPVPQRKAVKRSLGRSKSSNAADNLLPSDLLSKRALHMAQPHPSPDPFAFPLPKLPPILARPPCDDDTSREGTPTPTGQAEWLRIQMMKLMSTTPGCTAVPLRNLLNSPRAHSQPNSPCSARSPRSGTRSRPGTPKSRTPRGTSAKTPFQQTTVPNPNPSRLGVMPPSPTQRSKVARSGNPDVSTCVTPLEPVQPGPQHQHYTFAQHFGGTLVASGSPGVSMEQAARLHTVLPQPGIGGSNPHGASAAAVVAAVGAAGTATVPSGLLASSSESRPQSGESDKSTSSTAEVPSLEEVLDSLAGNRSALEAGGRLLHLQRSFSSGLTPDAVEHVLAALRKSKKVEVVYFPNIPMVLSEVQVELLLSTLQQRHIWALSLGEGTSLTAAGWELLATRLQTTALAYLYVSPATQASIPPTARACIRDGLHANRRAAPPRDPTLLAQMQVMSSTPQQPQAQAQAPQQHSTYQQPMPAAEPSQAPAQPVAAGTTGGATAKVPLPGSPTEAAGPGAPPSSPVPPAQGASPKAGVKLENPSESPAAAGAQGTVAASCAAPEAHSLQQEDSRTNSSGTSQPEGGADTTTTPTSSATSLAGSPPAPLEFADLVAVGYVQPGQYQLTVAGNLVEVAVLPTGSIQLEGTEFATLAAFVQAVACKKQLACVQLDPWKEVLLHGISLEALRQAFIERQQ